MIKVVIVDKAVLLKGDDWEMEEGRNPGMLVLNVTKGVDDEQVVLASFRHWDYVMLVDDSDEKPVPTDSPLVYERPRAVA